MHPLLNLFGSEVAAYRLFTILALLVATAATGWVANRRGLAPSRTVVFLAAVLAGALAGARLFAAAAADDPFWGGAGDVFALKFGDMGMFGGLAGASLTGFVAARWLGERPERLADHAAPAIAIGIVLLRAGCLLAGCCFGRETGLPWGITYPDGSLSHLQQRSESVWGLFGAPRPAHPIPVYEMLAAALLAAVAWGILRRGARDGSAFAVVVGGYAAIRLLIHPFRVPGPSSTPGWFDPVMYLAVALIAIAWLLAPIAKAHGSAYLGRTVRAPTAWFRGGQTEDVLQ